ncbi:uncharacterized protein LOC143609604 [Bidens hawaiensis]|uniref:uncharacterized protein LOC143609604 n=1 Tax=Bidens hawaiensis TaxID=980011 RepID=UPI00404983D6
MLQGESMVLSRFRLSDIELATQKFSETCCIGSFPYGKVYKAEINAFDNKTSFAFEEKNDRESPKTRITAAIKRIVSKLSVQGKEEFFSEIETWTSYAHPNIVSLLGFCDEDDEMILVYEHSSNKSLDDYLKNVDKMNNLTWTERLHMCLAVARGLDHLHTKIHNQQMVKLGEIRSANILIGKNWEPKIAYYGIPAYYLTNQEGSIPISKRVYSDPELNNLRAMRKQPYVFSFGVILFEVLCWRLAYDPIYIAENDQGLAAIACHHVYEGTIKSMMDPKLNEVSNEDILTSNRGPNQDSLATYLKIAYQCLVEPEVTMKVVIKELEIALNFQENLMKSLQLSLKDIEAATEKFSQKNWYGSGRCWEAYTGKLPHADTNTTILAKRWNSKFDGQFQTELDILLKRKHTNIVGIIGYCNKTNEKIIVHEHMSKGSLDRHLKDSTLKWMKRLQICIDVASALEFLHGGDVTLKKVVHRNIKSRSILLNDDWDAKISNFELSSLYLSNQDMEHIIHDAYLDPQYNRGFLTEKSDIYSFGVVLFEILCGRLAWVEGCEDKSQFLGPLAKHCYAHGKLDEIVFEDIKEQIVPKSLAIFADIAFQCLHEDDFERPQANKVTTQLKKALEFQEEFEIWEAKLPRDYQEIIGLSETPEIYQTEKKKDLYKKLSNGIFLPKEKVWYILSDNGEANKMISATTFSYENHKSHKWRSIHKSRFRTVAKMLDISNLMIKITINTRFLSPDVVYGIYLVFKFCDPRKLSCKSMYVNLKYTNETKTLHSYFATWRDDEWMMIELHRFLNHKNDVTFKFLLESFSRYYCKSDAVYIEGIEFRAIKNATHEDIKNHDDRSEKFLLSELNGKKHLVLSATEVLYNSSELKPFRFKSSTGSRFPDVVELLPQQVFRMKYEIEIQRLSPSTEYTCYLVFKVSERCQGLHCPVKVRDLLIRKNEEDKIIHFRSPAPSNQHDSFWVPALRKDGWMEVMVWKLNSRYNKLGNNYIPMNLKLITYEGTMSGLIICGLEFRPM